MSFPLDHSRDGAALLSDVFTFKPENPVLRLDGIQLTLQHRGHDEGVASSAGLLCHHHRAKNY